MAAERLLAIIVCSQIPQRLDVRQVFCFSCPPVRAIVV